MSIVRISHDKEKPYVMLNRAALQDRSISWAAKGLWAYLLSLPDAWEVSVAHLAAQYLGDKKGGKRDAIRNLLRELKDHGYVAAVEVRESGRFVSLDYTVYESKQPILNKEEYSPKKELKKRVPKTEKPGTVEPAPVTATQTINNDRKEIYKKNDKGAEPAKSSEKDRSSDAQHPIVSFCPQQYTFPDGSKISLRMQRAIAKYSEKDRQKLCAAIAYLEEQIRQKVKPKTSYEQWLQACIKHDYAGKQAREWQNRTYALWAKIEHDLKNVKILKTVVQVSSGDSEPPKSISFSLPEETFSEVIDAEIRKNKG